MSRCGISGEKGNMASVDMQVPRSTHRWVSRSVGMIHSWDATGFKLYYSPKFASVVEVEISISPKLRQGYKKV